MWNVGEVIKLLGIFDRIKQLTSVDWNFCAMATTSPRLNAKAFHDSFEGGSGLFESP